MVDTKSSHVELVCGTLIIIALIVLIFSGSSKVNELKGSVDQLTKQVIVLQEKVDSLSQAINRPRQ